MSIFLLLIDVNINLLTKIVSAEFLHGKVNIFN